MSPAPSEPRPLAAPAPFEPWDFEALAPSKAGSAEFNEHRLRCRRKLLALGMGLLGLLPGIALQSELAIGLGVVLGLVAGMLMHDPKLESRRVVADRDGVTCGSVFIPRAEIVAVSTTKQPWLVEIQRSAAPNLLLDMVNAEDAQALIAAVGFGEHEPLPGKPAEERTVFPMIARGADVYVKRWKQYAAGLKRIA